MKKNEKLKKVCEVKTKPFYEVDEFPQLKIFDENYQKILEELIMVLEKEASKENKKSFFEPWCETNLYEDSNPNGWVVAPMIINYKKDDYRCSKVPFLMSLVNQIPGLITVSFSMLRPGTWIVPHKGYDNYATVLLRYHLGLVVPKGDLGLRCDKKIRSWEAGKSWIFDDSLTHEAWNFTDKDRYVLIVDFAKDKSGKFNNERINFEICSLTEEVKEFIKADY